MDFSQESTPLKFIRFCLNNTTEENDQTPDFTLVETSANQDNQHTSNAIWK